MENDKMFLGYGKPSTKNFQITTIDPYGPYRDLQKSYTMLESKYIKLEKEHEDLKKKYERAEATCLRMAEISGTQAKNQNQLCIENSMLKDQILKLTEDLVSVKSERDSLRGE